MMILKGYNGLPEFIIIFCLCIIVSTLLFTLIEKKMYTDWKIFYKENSFMMSLDRRFYLNDSIVNINSKA